jgi:hypothetical protein
MAVLWDRRDRDAAGEMYERQRIGSDAFVGFMRTLSALALLVAIGGAVFLTLQAGDAEDRPAVDFVSGYGPGLLLLEPADEVGPDPFTAPVAVDLDIDQALLAFPPLSPDTFDEPHRRGSAADLMAAGEFGWALVEARDLAGGRIPVSGIRALVGEVLGLDATVADLDDFDGDSYDDDGFFTLRAADESAVCITPGQRRTLTEAQGAHLDAEDGAPANGLSWTSYGPCGSDPPQPRLSPARTSATSGVFGAVGNGEVCDLGLLVSSLQSNARAADGWATVQGIAAEEIPGFVSTLTPVVLLEDTVVTNFGWRDGQVAPRQSVLQRGTSVLVDRRGSPVARCLSGSPLRPPQPLPAAPSFQGEEWPGFGRAFLDEILAADREVLQFVLVDIATGQPIRRAPGLPGALSSLAGPVYVVEG